MNAEPPSIDCTVPLTNIKPKRGQILVELLPSPTKIGMVELPPQIAARAGVGGALVEYMAKFPAQKAIVRKIGETDPKHPYEFVLGDTIAVKYYSGTNVNQPPRKFKMMPGREVLAVFC